jgi:hypothetical protein
MDDKFVLFHLEGGLGKHIAATAVAKCIKNNHPDRQLIVVCAYPEVFLNLPCVDRVYRIGMTPYFYQDYIQNGDIIIYKHEPYFTTSHIKKEKPLIQNWCELYNLEFTGETPEIIFNLRQKQFGTAKWQRSKKIFLIHTNGGPLEGQQFPYSWSRDMPFNIAQEVADELSPYFHIIQVCRDQAQALRGVEVVSEKMSNTELLFLNAMATKRLLIDSCLQHGAAALGLPSTVLWIGTSPKTFGYNLHINIEAKMPEKVKLPDSYLFDYSFHGPLHECPFNESDFFDAQEIAATVRNQ